MHPMEDDGHVGNYATSRVVTSLLKLVDVVHRMEEGHDVKLWVVISLLKLVGVVQPMEEGHDVKWWVVTRLSNMVVVDVVKLTEE